MRTPTNLWKKSYRGLSFIDKVKHIPLSVTFTLRTNTNKTVTMTPKEIFTPFGEFVPSQPLSSEELDANNQNLTMKFIADIILDLQIDGHKDIVVLSSPSFYKKLLDSNNHPVHFPDFPERTSFQVVGATFKPVKDIPGTFENSVVFLCDSEEYKLVVGSFAPIQGLVSSPSFTGNKLDLRTKRRTAAEASCLTVEGPLKGLLTPENKLNWIIDSTLTREQADEIIKVVNNSVLE